METRFLIIDKDMNTVVVDINKSNFKYLGIDFSKIKKHKLKRDLNVTITEYLDTIKKEKA